MPTTEIAIRSPSREILDLAGPHSFDPRTSAGSHVERGEVLGELSGSRFSEFTITQVDLISPVAGIVRSAHSRRQLQGGELLVRIEANRPVTLSKASVAQQVFQSCAELYDDRRIAARKAIDEEKKNLLGISLSIGFVACLLLIATIRDPQGVYFLALVVIGIGGWMGYTEVKKQVDAARAHYQELPTSAVLASHWQRSVSIHESPKADPRHEA